MGGEVKGAGGEVVSWMTYISGLSNMVTREAIWGWKTLEEKQFAGKIPCLVGLWQV